MINEHSYEQNLEEKCGLVLVQKKSAVHQKIRQIVDKIAGKQQTTSHNKTIPRVCEKKTFLFQQITSTLSLK